MTTKITATMAQVPAAVRPVIVADWRPCKVLTPAVSERAVAMMSGVNARIERSAILHDPDSSTSVLQLMRLIKETNAPNRRLFTEPSALCAWLGEILSADESARLSEFLLER